MAFLDDVKRSLTITGKQVAEKTKEITDTVRLKNQIASEKDALLKCYEAVGRRVIEMAAPEDEERFSEAFSLIRATKERIAKLEEALLEIDGSMCCPECGAKIEKNSLFCSKCGIRVERVKSSAETFLEDAKDFAGEISDKVKEGAGQAAEKAKEAVEEAAEKVQEIVEDVKEESKED